MAREREHACDGVAVGGVTGGGNGERPGGIRRDHLHLDPLGLGGGSRTEGLARSEDFAERGDEPVVRHSEIEESGPRGLRTRDEITLEC